MKRALASLLLLAAPGLAAAGEKPVDLSKPFQHATHLDELRKEGDRPLSCGDCHVVTATVGAASRFPICEKLEVPYPTHDRCTGCHAKGFFKKPLQICASCHEDARVDAKAPLKPQRGGIEPLRAELSHRKHLDPKLAIRGLPPQRLDCTACHALLDRGARLAEPGHAECCGCHTKDAVTPSMDECAGCHARGAKDGPRRAALRKFSHEDHASDPVTRETLACTRCHARVARAEHLREVRPPEMDTCIECHTGEHAFDFAKCLKCHGPEIESRPVPKSHEKRP